jgi:Protein of unknown function (DUF2934)
MPERLVDVERQGAEVLHTDTLALRPAGEEPEANLDQVVRERAYGEVTEEVIRERAYLLWEQAGRPEGHADDFWHKAQTQILGIE